MKGRIKRKGGVVRVKRVSNMLYGCCYKNYYYIPLQDCAIHKHVASYLDPRERIPAKATTCYQRHRGLFLPQEKALFKPVFQESYHSDSFWFECTQQFMNSPSLLCLYIKSLISI